MTKLWVKIVWWSILACVSVFLCIWGIMRWKGWKKSS